MWLIAGLGNPGPEYRNTRHNLGFMVVEAVSARWKIPIMEAGRGLAVGRGRRRGEDVILAKPLAYMNRSGEALGPLVVREKADPERILVLVDDLDLPLGTIRFRPRGGTAGHRGMESLVRALGTEGFPRMRLGIGRPQEDMAESDYVLAPFSPEELPAVSEVVAAAVTLVEKVVFEGITEPRTVKSL